jgi:hypothetical protein
MVTASPSHTLYCFPWILTTTKTEGAGFAAARSGAASDMPLLPKTASAGLNIRDERQDAGEGVDAEVPHAPSQDPRAAGARGAADIAWRDEGASVVHTAQETDFPKLIAPPKDLLRPPTNTLPTAPPADANILDAMRGRGWFTNAVSGGRASFPEADSCDQ